MSPVQLRKDKFLYLMVIIIVSILVIWLAFSYSDDSVDFEEDTIMLTNSEKEQIKLSVEIAETQEEKKQGLMNRDSLCENCGMLFVYEENVHKGFWMKNTQIPLSIAFISKDRTIMEIQQMEPETTETHKPKEPYRYALEVNQGFFEDNHVNVGDVLLDNIVLTNSEGKQIESYVEIAETAEEKGEGLMNRDSLCENCGMLFVYEHDVHSGFWMKNTQIPLSIAFISEEGTIMEIQKMEPEMTETHKPEEPYRYALEVNQDFFEENQVGVGDQVLIPDRYEND